MEELHIKALWPVPYHKSQCSSSWATDTSCFVAGESHQVSSLDSILLVTQCINNYKNIFDFHFIKAS